MSSALTIIRILLGVLGGYLVKDGILTSSEIEQLGAALVVVIPITWGMWKNFHKNAQLDKVEAGATPDEAKASTPLLAK